MMCYEIGQLRVLLTRRHGKAHADRYAAPANTEGRTASTDCGSIPRWLKPAASGLATLSIAMRSTWLRVIGGLGSTSHISASACQIAKGNGSKIRFTPAA